MTNNYLLISWIEMKSNGNLKSNEWISKRNTMSQYYNQFLLNNIT